MIPAIIVTATVMLFMGANAANAADLEVCFDVLDQPAVVEDATGCSVVGSGFVIDDFGFPVGPYVLPMEASGVLLCNAVQSNYSGSQRTMLGTIEVDYSGVFPTISLTSVGVAQYTCSE